MFYICKNCQVSLTDEIFISDYEDGPFCDSECYVDWYVEKFGVGYYTAIGEYEKEIKHRSDELMEMTKRNPTLRVEAEGMSITNKGGVRCSKQQTVFTRRLTR